MYSNMLVFCRSIFIVLLINFVAPSRSKEYCLTEFAGDTSDPQLVLTKYIKYLGKDIIVRDEIDCPSSVPIGVQANVCDVNVFKMNITLKKVHIERHRQNNNELFVKLTVFCKLLLRYRREVDDLQINKSQNDSRDEKILHTSKDPRQVKAAKTEININKNLKEAGNSTENLRETLNIDKYIHDELNHKNEAKTGVEKIPSKNQKNVKTLSMNDLENRKLSATNEYTKNKKVLKARNNAMKAENNVRIAHYIRAKAERQANKLDNRVKTRQKHYEEVLKNPNKDIEHVKKAQNKVKLTQKLVPKAHRNIEKSHKGVAKAEKGINKAYRDIHKMEED